MNTRPSMTKLVALAFATALTLGACQTTDQVRADLPTLTAPASDGSADTEEGGTRDEDEEVSEADADLAMAQFESCMSDAGVEIGGAGADGGFTESFESDTDVSNEAADVTDIEAAMEKCNSILEDAFGEFDLSPEEEAELEDANLELSRCLADAGFDVDLSSSSFTLDESIDFEEFEAAMTACSPDTEFGSAGVDE